MRNDPVRRPAARVAGFLLAAAGFTAVPGRAAAQAAITARTFEFRARDGLTRQLEDGYRRHLDWHLEAGDRWAWYLWQVIDGERAGLYLDGTFGHPWGDFDAAVDPAGDGADNELNVEPFAIRAANHVWRLRPDLGPGSGAAALPESARYVIRTEYRPRPDGEAAFLRALRGLRAAAGGQSYAVYQLVSGGDLPTYAVWAPESTWAEIGAFADQTAAADHLAGAAARVRAELLRFRPDLSICRRKATGCYRTLP